MCCPLVFEFSVGKGGFVIGLSQISFFFPLLENMILELEAEGPCLGHRSIISSFAVFFFT